MQIDHCQTSISSHCPCYCL